jgi:hypothetical protein
MYPHIDLHVALQSTHGEFLRLLSLIANKQADAYFQALDYMPHKEEFCHRRSVSFSSTSVHSNDARMPETP